MRLTPLHNEHTVLGAKMVDFHGWHMPLQYAGVLDEHHHCRHHTAIFDCSHMGEFYAVGAEAAAALNPFVFLDLFRIRPGRCRYTSILTECGGIMDDVVIARLDVETLLVITNSGPLDKVSRFLSLTVPGIENVSDATAKIDVQGPESRQVLLDLGFAEAATLSFYGISRTTWRGADVVLTRAGYTGELGYELYVPNDVATPLWRALLERPSVAPAGLGARDTLRLEMGFTLYGQDVDENVTSLEAGMSRFIDWDSDFKAKESLWLQREQARYKVRTGIQTFDRRAPRPGFEVRHKGMPAGVVTSGTYGPTVGRGIGVAYLPLALAVPGTRLTAGPKDIEIEVAALPFYRGGSAKN